MYSTAQNYTYDNLYQLTGVTGTSVNNPYRTSTPDYTAKYTQTYTYDTKGLGNMETKTSSTKVTTSKTLGDGLDYDFDYEYESGYVHRVKRIDTRYYQYDLNGNIVLEREGEISGTDSDTLTKREVFDYGNNVHGSAYGWALKNDEGTTGGNNTKEVYQRIYTWGEQNRLVQSSDNQYTVVYRYGSDGQRALKSTGSVETAYFSKLWTWTYNKSAYGNGARTGKHIYLNSDRLVTKLNNAENPTESEGGANLYYYHSDHLGSAQMVTDYRGQEYERLEYTPWGEVWIDKAKASNSYDTPYRFTGKERDTETGLYYYGARYYDAKYSRWLSCDPALGEYIPQAPENDEAKKHNKSLAGQGGVFNVVNLDLYHYAANNPVKYTDPDGKMAIVSTPIGPVFIPFIPLRPIEPSKPMQPSSPSNGRVLGDNWAFDSGQKKGSENTEADQAKAGLEGSAQSAAPGANEKSKSEQSPEKDSRVRGLPPSGINPPVDGKVTPGDASRPSEKDKGGKSLWDDNGGEWRYFPEDKYHNPHWDYNPHNTPNSAWENIRIGNLPVEK